MDRWRLIMQWSRTWLPLTALALVAAASASPTRAQQAQTPGCASLPTAAELQGLLRDAASGTGISVSLGPDTDAGGIFGGSRMWGAIVNRQGQLCAVNTSTDDPTQVFPGSRAIAEAKAYTANAFSLDDFDLPTARMYTLTQPGHSLAGLNNSNPFDPRALSAPSQPGIGANQIAAGIITFGGGVPLYQDGRIVGGLGVSGDTSCADHEVAKRARDLAGLNPPDGPLSDDIVYAAVDGPSMFAHPICPN